jgi:hypothetical protein
METLSLPEAGPASPPESMICEGYSALDDCPFCNGPETD